MLLTQENICHYLLERNTLSEELIVNGDFITLPVSGSRNNLFKVLCNSGKNLFVKQPARFDPASVSILAKEANSYRFLSQNNMYPKVSSCLPAFHDYDKYRHVLTVEYFPGASSIHDYFIKQRKYFPELAEQQAELLSSYHVTIPDGTDVSIFPKSLPWILQVYDFKPNELFPNQKTSEELLSIVHANTELKTFFEELKKDYKITSLIHGDIKWTNFIIYPHDEGMKQSLIDWELADLGDPCWDVAGLLQSYVSTWIFSFDNMDPWSKELKPNMKDFDISNMQQSISRFWNAYSGLMGLDAVSNKEMLIKCMRFTAARIIQTSVESIVSYPHLYPNNVRSIQIAFNILKSPRTAISELLGIKI